MLKLDNALYKVILIFNLILAAASGVGGLYVIVNPGGSSAMTTAADLCLLIAIFAALYYIFLGYRKNAARYFKFYTVFFAFSALFSSIGAGTHGDALQLIICPALVVVLVGVMTFVPNLGKKNSLLICTLTIIFCAVNLVIGVVDFRGGITSGEDYAIATLIRVIAGLVLAVLLTLMTTAKYLDKAERGSK